MLKMKEYEKSTSKNEMKIDSVRKLIKKKAPIICENGVAQIDSSHPDYDFWMED